MPADAVAAAGYDDDLLRPVVGRVGDGVVEGPGVEVAVEGAGEAEVQQGLEARVDGRVVEAEALAAVGEVEVERQGEGEGWVEEGVLEEPADRVGGEAWTLLEMF